MSVPTCWELLEKMAESKLHPPHDAVSDLAARVERVLALHRHVKGAPDWCEECRDSDGNPSDWPCETVRRLDGAEQITHDYGPSRMDCTGPVSSPPADLAARVERVLADIRSQRELWLRERDAKLGRDWSNISAAHLVALERIERLLEGANP